MTLLAHLFHFLSAKALSHAAEAGAAALVAGLWQGIALAALTGVVLRSLPRTSASVRFIVWTAVFCVSAAMPLVHLFHASGGATSGPVPQLRLNVGWSYLLAAMWVLAALARLGMLAYQGAVLRGLWQSAVPAPTDVMNDPELRATLAKRGTEVCTSNEVDRPSVIGFFAPRILIPKWLFGQMSALELRHIVMHELEHLRRRDDWVNLMQQVGLVVFPLNPAMFWIDRRLAAEREVACDDGVLERTRTPRAYAASLTSIAERRLSLKTRRRLTSLALAAVGADRLLRRRSEFGRRIEGILGRRTAARPALAGGLAVVLLAAVFASAAGMLRAPEFISFRSSADSQDVASQSAGDLPIVTARQASSVSRFEDARFRPSHTKRVPGRAAASRHQAAATPSATATQIAGDYVVAEPREVDSGEFASNATLDSRLKPQLLVLTSSEKAAWQAGSDGSGVILPVARVLVRMPGGKVYATPYAAVPTQAGWLIVQL